MKYFFSAFVCIFFLSFSNFTVAQTFSVDYKASFGSAQYVGAVELNDFYYFATRTNDIDVYDFTKGYNDSLIHKYELEDVSSIIAIEKFDQDILIFNYDKLRIFAVNESTLELKYSINVRFDSDEFGVTTNDGIYFITPNDELFHISKGDNGYEIENVTPLAIENYNGNYGIQGASLINVEGQLYYFYKYYNGSEWTWNAVIIDTETYNLVAHHRIHDFFGDKVVHHKDNSFFIRNNGRLVQISVTESGISTPSEVGVYNYNAEIINLSSQYVWTFNSYGMIEKYFVDGTDFTLIKQTKLDMNGEYWINTHLNELFSNKSIFINNIHGITVLSFDKSSLKNISHYANVSGHKGSGAFHNGFYVLSSPHQERISTMSLGDGVNVINQHMERYVYNIFPHNDGLIFGGSDAISFNTLNNYGELYSVYKSHVSSANNPMAKNEKYLFYSSWVDNKQSISRQDISNGFSLYVSPVSISFPNDYGCIEKILLLGDKLIANDPCGKNKWHLFSDINSTSFNYEKTIDDSELISGVSATNGELLYTLVGSNLFINSVNQDYELVSFGQLSVDVGYSIRELTVVDDYLFIVGYDTVYLFDLLDNLNPKFLFSFSRANDSYEEVSLAYLDGLLAISSTYDGKVEFYDFNYAPTFTHNQNELVVDEDNELDLNSLFEDPEGDDFSLSVEQDPVNGLIDTDIFVYQPNQDFNGQDSFVVKAEDIHGNYIEQEIILNIHPINDLPFMNNANLQTQEDTQLIEDIEVVDVDGDTVTLSITHQPENGTASINDKGELSYTPNAEYSGGDELTVALSDGVADVEVVVGISVIQVNDAPVFNEFDLFQTDEDSQLTGKVAASDVEGQALTYSVVVDSAIGGTATVELDGNFTFTPEKDFFGDASFEVQVKDADGAIAQSIVEIVINPVDDAPIVESINETVSHNGSVNGNLASEDVDGDSLTYELVDNVSNGSLSLSSNGEYSYSPSSGFSGSDSFTYKVTDGKSEVQGTVSFTVQSAPVQPNTKSSDSSSGGSVTIFAILFLNFLVLIRLYQSRNLH